ncbi:hypothetical protein [Lacticaseibacillus paracasei]|uniref:CHAD domain-containing protein n=1 Tax=Lacticaseibacillus paracasei TaxID=1597 RepID=A0ABD6VW69_LACPA|nr:hypothetical protein [Lacticaseibacillus paracasei]MCT3379465.1 hypothetical protein [Lacticaseibacillus paracasei]POE38087.1 hypothetical protein ACX51_15920 [Lacticaseibacillus paracasei]QHV91704.1 hypothetical protein EOK76_g1253 [Lacticaseibacillus paracasei]
MLSEQTVKELISTPVFISNASKLAYMLHDNIETASQELLLELMFHRLRLWSNKDLTLAVQRDLPSLKWRIKYARLDLVRKAVRDVSRELEKASMVAHMEPQASNEAETLEALGRLRELFKNAHTRDWVESVLRVGQRETMVRFNQTPRQFNCKLNKVCRYARKWQPKQSNSHEKELHILGQWDDLMNDTGTTDDDVQAFINSHQDYINEVINSPQVAYQVRLIKNLKHAGKDKYILVNLMAKREQELKEKDIDE